MWPTDAEALVAAQHRLAVATPDPWRPGDRRPLRIGGVWVCFPRGLTGRGAAGDPAWAAAVAMRDGRVLGQQVVTGTTGAAYVPGLLALRMGAPAMVLVVPASYGLLPGLAIFRGLYEMVTHASANSGTLSMEGGITTLLGAFAVLLAIATGTVLGEFLGAPFDHRMVQKRRARRR